MRNNNKLATIDRIDMDGIGIITSVEIKLKTFFGNYYMKSRNNLSKISLINTCFGSVEGLPQSETNAGTAPKEALRDVSKN